jgi:hypothetical protein
MPLLTPAIAKRNAGNTDESVARFLYAIFTFTLRKFYEFLMSFELSSSTSGSC